MTLRPSEVLKMLTILSVIALAVMGALAAHNGVESDTEFHAPTSIEQSK